MTTLIIFTKLSGDPVAVNPEQVVLVEPYTDGQGAVTTHIKTINASTTVTERFEEVVRRLSP